MELLPSTSVIECRVSDNGIGEPVARSGNGTKIIASLAESLGGTIAQHFGPQGTTTVLAFPAEIETNNLISVAG